MTSRLVFLAKIFGVIAITAIFGVLLYFLFFRGGPDITPDTPGQTGTDQGSTSSTGGLTPSQSGGDRTNTGGGTDQGGSLPSSPIADGGPTLTVQLTSSSAQSPTLTEGNKITFYDKKSGAFYLIDTNGELLQLNSNTFPEAETVVFSTNAQKAALEFPDGSNIVYDLLTDKQTTLPSHWEDFTFSPDSEQLVSKSMGSDPYSRTLVVTNANGSQAEAIAILGNNADEVELTWSPNDTVVAFSETGSSQSAFGRQEIYLIDKNGDANNALIVEGSNFEAIWSPSGNGILYSVADPARNDRPSLWYSSADGSNRQELSVETWVEKCTFKSETSVICAIPKEVKNYSGFDHRLIDAGDNLYEINLTSKRSTLLAELTTEMQMFNLTLSNDQSILYFSDGAGRLNSMRLR